MSGKLTPGARPWQDPLLLVPIAAYVVLTFAFSSTYPSILPTDSATLVLETLRADPGLAQVSALLLIAAGAPLVVWSAAVNHRLQTLGARAAAPIALVGGILAGVGLIVSGILGSAAATLAVLGDAFVVKAITVVSFLAGGVGFALGSAVLVAGVAVPCVVDRLVPGWVAYLGVAVSLCGVVALGSVVEFPLSYLLPVTRFVGMLWLITISLALPVTTHARAEEAVVLPSPSGSDSMEWS